jgi:ADP-ribose pyrophosphatase YjhB (NUDIX family)
MKTWLIQKVLFPLARLYWKVVRPRTFGVKGVVVRNCDDALLLVRHAYGNTSIWNLPGGGYRPRREAPADAVVREIHEELGLDVTAPEVLGEYRTQAQGKRDTVTIFVCPVADDPPRLGDEIAEARWFPLSDIDGLAPVYGITTHALELYRESVTRT